MSNTKELTVQSSNTNVFIDQESFNHAQRVAKMLCASDLVPATFKGKIENCVIALNMASRIGADPLMVMQNIYIVHGKPAWSSQFLIATVNASGKFSPLRYEEDGNNGGRCRAYAIDIKTNERCDGIWVSMEMAAAEGWSTKSGSKWKTMPQLMLRYRAATFFQRQFCPEIGMGISTKEEIEDIGYVDVVSQNNPAPKPSTISEAQQIVNSCNTWEELEELKANNPDDAEIQELAIAKQKMLKQHE